MQPIPCFGASGSHQIIQLHVLCLGAKRPKTIPCPEAHRCMSHTAEYPQFFFVRKHGINFILDQKTVVMITRAGSDNEQHVNQGGHTEYAR